MAGAPAPSDQGSDADHPLIVHAGAIAVQGRAVVIAGASGRGKSALALRLMALGAGLVADDRTCLWRDGARLWADAPQALRGRIEARGVGILRAPAVGPAEVALWVDLDRQETARLPDWHRIECLGLSLPLLHDAAMPHFPAAIMTYLLHGRSD